MTPKLTFKFQFRITVVQKLIRPLLSSDAVEPAEAQGLFEKLSMA